MPEPIADLFNALLKALLAAEQEDKKANDLESLVSNAGQDLFSYTHLDVYKRQHGAQGLPGPGT